jgi:hypothetical protein
MGIWHGLGFKFWFKRIRFFVRLGQRFRFRRFVRFGFKR